MGKKKNKKKLTPRIKRERVYERIEKLTNNIDNLTDRLQSFSFDLDQICYELYDLEGQEENE